MSVHILYRSNHGNNFFQYVAARLLAERSRLALATPWKRTELALATTPAMGREINRGLRVLTDEDDVLDRWWGYDRYLLDGYFQVSRWYHVERERVRSYFELPPVKEEHPEDVCVSLRIGKDYRTLGWRIDPRWYTQLLMKMAFRKMHLVTDVEDSEYLSHFEGWEPVRGGGSYVEDWHYIRRFKRVICANSTFSWWACFLGAAVDVTTFKPWVPHPHVRVDAFPGGEALPGDFERGVK